MLNDEVKKYVDKNNISIVDFMRLAGVSRSTYYNYVNGLNQPTLKIALRIIFRKNSKGLQKLERL